MTLLELLRQELPKRGGWPESYNYMAQDPRGSASAGKIYAYVNKPKRGVYCWINEDDESGYGNFVMKSEIIAEDSITAIVTREQYEATGWGGVGLPQIGVECEWQDKNTGKWQPVKIVYASEWVTVIREINEEKDDDLVEIAIENYGDDARLKFRPLRTEAERAIDEMVRLSGVSIGAAKILYDAGYRK